MKGKTLSEMIGDNVSPTAKLALLIEKVVRKVVREELKQLTEGRGTVGVNITALPTRISPTLPPAIEKAAAGNPLLREIFANTTPFNQRESAELAEVDPTSLMAEGWGGNAQAPATITPAPVVDIPGLDPAVSHIANVLNNTNFKAILDRSKSFDRH